jgi:LysR family transcriptional regulator, benzoate and cis,cis-muconate-responsive activator of ben and cat genes
LEIRHLRAFIAVADADSVRQAAGRLRVAQSALSRTIRDLEHEVGVVLFARNAQGVRITAGGTRFLEGARRTLVEASAAIARARDVRVSGAGHLVVGIVNPELRPAWVQAALQGYRKAMPDVMVHLVSMCPIAMVEAATERVIDVGIGYALAPSHGIRVTRVTDDELAGVLVAPTHRLARRRGVRTVDLEAYPFLWSDRTMHPVLFDRIFAAFRQVGFAPRHVPAIDQVSANAASAFALVSSGFGWILYPSMARPALPPTLRYLALTDVSIPLETDLLRRSDDRSERTRAFVHIVEQLAADGSGEYSKGDR